MNLQPDALNDSRQHALELDTTIYSHEAIKRAAYKFADRTSIVILPGSGSTVIVKFTFVGATERNDPKQIMADFCNELLDQDLREIIRKETHALRSVIIAHAFSRSSLVEE